MNANPSKPAIPSAKFMSEELDRYIHAALAMCRGAEMTMKRAPDSEGFEFYERSMKKKLAQFRADLREYAERSE